MTRAVDIDRLIDERGLSTLQWQVIGTCALVAFLDGLDTQSIGIAAPAIGRMFHWSPAVFAPVFSLGLLGGMGGALAMGPIADRAGRKWPMVIVVLMMAAGTLGCATATSLPGLIGWRVLAGAALGAANPCFIALTSEYAPARRRGTLVALMWAAFPLGGVLGGLVNPALIGSGGWRFMFAVDGVASALIAAPCAIACPESLRFLALRGAAPARIRSILARLAPAAAGADTFTLSSQPVRSARVWQLFSPALASRTLLLWLVFAINFAALAFTPLWAPTLLSAPAGLTLAQSAALVSIWNLGSVLGAGGIGRVFDWFSPARVMVGLYLLAGVCVATIGSLAHQPTWVLVLAAACAANFCLGAASSGALILSSSIYPTALRSTGIGWAMGMGRAGQVASSGIVAFALAAHWKAPQIFLALGACAWLAALGSLVIQFRQTHAGRRAAGEQLSPPLTRR